MTTALKGELQANWLSRYLVVERKYDKYLYKTFSTAAEDTERKLAALEDIPGRGASLRRYQLEIAKSTMDELFGTNLTATIREHQGNAAVAATDALLYDERGLLSRIFSDSGQRKAYVDSMRATAQRNVEAAITRVYHSEVPLSKRVWRSEALAKGWVDTAINNALARGDSARDLAKTVAGMIRPDTPGGVSYAAMRLGRSEINNAFHAQSILETQETPWITHMEWHRSGTPSRWSCECDYIAAVGLFEKEQVPEKPHPSCRCYVVPLLPDWDNFENAMLMGQYDEYLDETLGEGTAEVAFASRREPSVIEEQVEAEVSAWEAKETAKQEAVDRIHTAFSEVDAHGGLQGWQRMDERSVSELADAAEDLSQKYPDVRLLRLSFGDAAGDNYGITYQSDSCGYVDDGKNYGPNAFYSRIVLNKNLGMDYDTWQYKATSDATPLVPGKNLSPIIEREFPNGVSGFHPVGSDERPVLSTFNHEFAHAMVNSLGGDYDWVPDRITTRDCTAAVRGAWRESKTEEPYYTWIQTQLSRYSFKGNWELRYLDKDEAIAEAFDAVERLGEKASPAEQALHRLLTTRYRERYGTRKRL